MRMKIMTTVNDLRNWVDTATWEGRTEADLDTLVDAIRTKEGCPAWGEDFREFLDRLPENLVELL